MAKSVFDTSKALIRLALPIVLGNMCYCLLGISDTVMSGLAGTSDLAGVSVGGSFFFPSIMFLIGLISAMHPIIGHLRGEGRYEDIPHAHKTVFVTTFIASIFVFFLLLLVPTLFLHIQSDARMAEVTKYYLLAVAISVPVSAFFSSLRAFCEACGDTKATLYFGFITLLYNIPLNYIFIFGLFSLPKLGGIGCGVATVISMSLTSILLCIYIRCKKDLYVKSMFVCKKKITLKDIKDYFKLSLPLGLSTCVECSCFALIALLLSPLGSIEVSAHTIALNTTSLLFNMPLSIGIATAITVGYNLGNNDILGLKNTIKASYRVILISIAIALTLIYSLKSYIPNFWSSDEDVYKLASILLFCAMLNQIFENLQFVQASILRGFKDTKTIFKITLISFYVIALPLGSSLCYGYIKSPFAGAIGFWIGLLVALSFASIAYRCRVLYHYRCVKGKLKNSAM